VKILLEVISLIGIVLGLIFYSVSEINPTDELSSTFGGLYVLIGYPSFIVFLYLKFFCRND